MVTELEMANDIIDQIIQRTVFEEKSILCDTAKEAARHGAKPGDHVRVKIPHAFVIEPQQEFQYSEPMNPERW